MDRQYNDQKKHGQTIQRPTETRTDNTTTRVIRNCQSGNFVFDGDGITYLSFVIDTTFHVFTVTFAFSNSITIETLSNT